mmetsp:Transcript_44308/g.128116  ORF Transcript_44308/g.128116 Transcript_44308/m.128116 type:complete len:388 (+) Transcript_44308:135-1298(+)
MALQARLVRNFVGLVFRRSIFWVIGVIPCWTLRSLPSERAAAAACGDDPWCGHMHATPSLGEVPLVAVGQRPLGHGVAERPPVLFDEALSTQHKEPGHGDDLRQGGYLTWLASAMMGLSHFTVFSPTMLADGHLVCHDRHPERLTPPRLILFDFDETLTIQTWQPTDDRFRTVIGHALDDELAARVADVTFGHSSGRLARLRRMLEELARGGAVGQPVLAVLTKSDSGAVGVLNTLRLAGLSRYFSAIWRVNRLGADAVYRVDSGSGIDEWQKMPLDQVMRFDSKGETVRKIAKEPAAWFPQRRISTQLQGFAAEEVVLVDDDPGNIEGFTRYCMVPRFDEADGHMKGGIGRLRSTDFKTVLEFVTFLHSKAEHPNMFKALHWFGGR